MAIIIIAIETEIEVPLIPVFQYFMSQSERHHIGVGMGYLYLGLAIISEVIGTSALQASNGFTKLMPNALVVLGYGTAFYLLGLTLKYMPVGIAYAIWAGLGIVLIAIIGAVVFKQIPDIPAVIGMILIVAGVLVIHLFSQTAGH